MSETNNQDRRPKRRIAAFLMIVPPATALALAGSVGTASAQESRTTAASPRIDCGFYALRPDKYGSQIAAWGGWTNRNCTGTATVSLQRDRGLYWQTVATGTSTGDLAPAWYNCGGTGHYTYRSTIYANGPYGYQWAESPSVRYYC